MNGVRCCVFFDSEKFFIGGKNIYIELENAIISRKCLEFYLSSQYVTIKIHEKLVFYKIYEKRISKGFLSRLILVKMDFLTGWH